MQNTLTTRHHINVLGSFQIKYFLKLFEGIPLKKITERGEAGMNSPLWLLGHLVVEGVDVLEKLHQVELVLKLKYWKPEWKQDFAMGQSGDWETSRREQLLQETSLLMQSLQAVYEEIQSFYLLMTEEELKAAAPSEFLEPILGSTEAWLLHHTTTHIGIHAGNLANWKKAMGLPVGGY